MPNSKLEEKVTKLKEKWDEVKNKIETSKQNSESLFTYTESLSQSHKGDVQVLISLKEIINKLSSDLENITDQMGKIDVGDEKLKKAKEFLNTIQEYKNEVGTLNKAVLNN